MTARGKSHDDAIAALGRVLGAPPPQEVAGLGAGELTRLCEAIEDAKARSSEALSVALDEALLQVPSLLRGPVKRIVLR